MPCKEKGYIFRHSLDLLPNLFRSFFGLAWRSEKGYSSLIVGHFLKEVERKIMERFDRALKLPNAQFKRIIGTTKAVFQKMLEVLQAAYDQLHVVGGLSLRTSMPR